MASPRSSIAQREAESHQEHIDLGQQVHRRMTETSRQDEAYGAQLNDLRSDSDEKTADEDDGRRNAQAVPASRLPPSRAWKTLFSQEVAQDWMLEAQLFALTLSTGIQDATTFGDFNVFTTKQTGAFPGFFCCPAPFPRH
nr:hypothetical protein CFP56_74671 [Quercus suber]